MGHQRAHSTPISAESPCPAITGHGCESCPSAAPRTAAPRWPPIDAITAQRPQPRQHCKRHAHHEQHREHAARAGHDALREADFDDLKAEPPAQSGKTWLEGGWKTPAWLSHRWLMLHIRCNNSESNNAEPSRPAFSACGSIALRLAASPACPVTPRIVPSTGSKPSPLQARAACGDRIARRDTLHRAAAADGLLWLLRGARLWLSRVWLLQAAACDRRPHALLSDRAGLPASVWRCELVARAQCRAQHHAHAGPAPRASARRLNPLLVFALHPGWTFLLWPVLLGSTALVLGAAIWRRAGRRVGKNA